MRPFSWYLRRTFLQFCFSFIKKFFLNHPGTWPIQSRDISIRHFQKRCSKFSPLLCTLSTGKPWCGARVWSIRPGRKKIATIETNKHPTKSTKKKRRNKSWFFFWTSFIQSFDIKFKVTSLKNSHVVFVLLLRIYFKLSWVEKVLTCPQAITTVLSKYGRTGTVETLTRSGRKRSFTNRDRNELKRLVKSNRRLTLQDITAKLNECKTKTFSQKTLQRLLHLEGYKRRLAKKKMVVREANRKKQVKWCKERRGRIVDNHWKKSNVFRWKSDCARNKQPLHACKCLHLAKRRQKVQPTPYLFSLWAEDKIDDLGMYFLRWCWNSDCSWRQHRRCQSALAFDKNLWPVVVWYFEGKEYLFMDDNAPVHRGHTVKNDIDHNEVTSMEWPAQ